MLIKSNNQYTAMSSTRQRAHAQQGASPAEGVDTRTQDDEAHGPGQDVVAGLAGRHLAQHGHRDGLDVERERYCADRGRERIWGRTPRVNVIPAGENTI